MLRFEVRSVGKRPGVLALSQGASDLSRCALLAPVCRHRFKLRDVGEASPGRLPTHSHCKGPTSLPACAAIRAPLRHDKGTLLAVSIDWLWSEAGEIAPARRPHTRISPVKKGV